MMRLVDCTRMLQFLGYSYWNVFTVYLTRNWRRPWDVTGI